MYFATFKKHRTDLVETFQLSLPILFGRLGAVLTGVLDNIMIGKTGHEPLAASGIATNVYFLLGIIPVGVLIVGSPIVSGFHSCKDKSGIVRTLKSCIQSSQLVSLAFVLPLLVLGFNFHWLGQTDTVTQLARPLFFMLILSTFPLMYFIAVEQFTDGLGKTGISMFFNVTALLVNGGINYCLIYGNFGFPKLGLLGAGIGTFMARMYMALGIWLYVRYSGKFADYPLGFNQFQVDKESLVQILKTGIPSGFQFFFELSAFTFATIAVGWLGTIPLAAHNIIISLASVPYMISSGFAAGGAIRVGYAYGTNKKNQMLRAARSTYVWAGSLVLLMSIVFVTMSRQFISLYNTEYGVVQVAFGLVWLLAIFQVADACNVVAIAALRAIQDVNVPALWTMFFFWAVGIPIGALLAFGFHLDVFGIWIGLLTAQILSATALSYRFFNMTRKM